MKNEYAVVKGKFYGEFEHIVITEKALGHKIPFGAVVHHVDGIKNNNIKSNLVLCQSQKYHYLLHLRERALNACGNKHYRLCVYCHQYDDTDNMKKPKYGGYYHVRCSSKARNANRKKNKNNSLIL